MRHEQVDVGEGLLADGALLDVRAHAFGRLNRRTNFVKKRINFGEPLWLSGKVMDRENK
jgi:hypothetical protein